MRYLVSGSDTILTQDQLNSLTPIITDPLNTVFANVRTQLEEGPFETQETVRVGLKSDLSAILNEKGDVVLADGLWNERAHARHGTPENQPCTNQL